MVSPTVVHQNFVPLPYSLSSHFSILEMPGKGPPECADGSQVLLPRALCSVTVPATTFPRLQAAVRANRVMDDPRVRWPGAGRGLQAKGGAPDPGPRSSGDQSRYLACLPAQNIRPNHSPSTWAPSRRPGGRDRLFLCERLRSAPSNRPGPLTRPTRVQNHLDRA